MSSHDEHPSVARVLRALADQGLEPEVRHLPDAVRTAEAAAQALEVTPAEIANSLIFVGTTDSGERRPVLVLASGGHRVDTARVGAALGVRLSRADADFVREHTGFAIGGVAPVGHLTAPIPAIDLALAGFDHIWAAAGHSHAVFRTTYAELLALTGATPLEVA